VLFGAKPSRSRFLSAAAVILAARTGVNMSKSAAYWEGHQAFATRQPCRYAKEDAKHRRAWAAGYGAAVSEDRGGKVWWKSKTVVVGFVLLIVGVVSFIAGQHVGGDNGSMMMGAGGALTLSKCLDIWLRTYTSQAVTCSNASYTPWTPHTP
jgi:hypothetical protein